MLTKRKASRLLVNTTEPKISLATAAGNKTWYRLSALRQMIYRMDKLCIFLNWMAKD
jgi:hypothetical protein